MFSSHDDIRVELDPVAKQINPLDYLLKKNVCHDENSSILMSGRKIQGSWEVQRLQPLSSAFPCPSAAPSLVLSPDPGIDAIQKNQFRNVSPLFKVPGGFLMKLDFLALLGEANFRPPTQGHSQGRRGCGMKPTIQTSPLQAGSLLKSTKAIPFLFRVCSHTTLSCPVSAAFTPSETASNFNSWALLLLWGLEQQVPDRAKSVPIFFGYFLSEGCVGSNPRSEKFLDVSMHVLRYVQLRPLEKEKSSLFISDLSLKVNKHQDHT
ncbi:hypothetical protein EK904_012498 [Melospiza melodia maxima]|nr:hypothetical protein EK904_012498 [Melospiza melodia maxima]